MTFPPNFLATRTAMLVLRGCFVERSQTYLPGWSDSIVTAYVPDRAGPMSAAEVEHIRRGAFGGQAQATALWRLRMAVELVERRFDYTEQLGARDLVAERVGEDELYRQQLAGLAPAGGAYERGWNDDKIAELTGVAPGDVYAIRRSIPWIRPDDRPLARRWRGVNGLPATRAARVMWLDLVGNPCTGKPHTVEEIAEILAGIDGGASWSWGGVDGVETTLRVGRVRIDTHSGRARTVTAIAAALGYSREWTYRLLRRFEADELAGERGKPSLLTPEILDRLRHADPRRFDRGSWYAWIAAWCWPSATGRPSTRTLKGWRDRGRGDAVRGGATPYREFAELVEALVAAAPAEAPILPAAEELATVAELPTRAAAVSLGVTLDQLAAAREAAGRTA